MPLFSRGPSIPAGWVAAPGDVQAEIFLVWQEDELPDELKQAPGYVPFTLSSGSEDWVRGMAEIKELDGPKEKMVIGRPRPPRPVTHRPLIAEPAPTAPSTPAAINLPPAWEPTMTAKEWIRRQAPREAPAIAVRTAADSSSARADERQVDRRTIPAIGGTRREEHIEPAKPSGGVRTIPQIGPVEEGSAAGRVADEPGNEHEKPQTVPEIGPP